MSRGGASNREPGLVDGVHYTGWVEQVRQLSREARDEEALALLERLMDAVEEEATATGYGVAPWYYEQAAKLHRRGKRYSDEIAVLSRYGSVSKSASLEPRLRKARELLAAQEEAKRPPFCPVCGVVLDPVPRASGPCPQCGEPLVLRRRAGKTVVAAKHENEARVLQRQKEKLRRSCLDRAAAVGIREEQFEQTEAELAGKWGRAAPGDVLWRLLNEEGVRLAVAEEWGRVGVIERAKASQLVAEGRDGWTDAVRRAVEAEMRALLRWNRPDTLLVLRVCGCAVCSSNAWKEARLDRVSGIDFPPHNDCATPPCSCAWTTPPLGHSLQKVTNEQAMVSVSESRRHGFSRLFRRG